MKKRIKGMNGRDDIIVQYISCEQAVGDTETEIYDVNKISILLSDGLVAVLDGELLGGQKGDVLLFNPDEVHFGRFLRPAEHRILELYLPTDFFGAFGADTAAVEKLFKKSENRVNCIRSKIEKSLEIIAIAEKIIKNLSSPQNEFEIFGLILQMVNILAKLYPKAVKNEVLNQAAPQVKTAIDYITQNFAKKITLNEIAQNCSCSIAYLSRQFKLYTGVTVHNFLTFQRLNYSAFLLRSGYSVLEAALQSGFDDCSNYIAAFKRQFNITPYKYKKEKV